MALFFGCGWLAAQPAKITTQGLILQVAPFEVEGLRFEGGQATATPSADQVLVVNQRTRALHVLPRSLGEGEIVLAKIETSRDGVASIEARDPVRPVARIPRVLERIETGASISVGCFGTSLVENGAAPGGWQRLVFDETLSSASPFSLTGDGPRFAVRNHAVGGTNARYSMALLGRARQDGRILETEVMDCEFAIVALLPNGGDDRLAAFEGVVRALRSRGIEVLLLTDNATAGQGARSVAWNDGQFVRALADRYGCALADTAAYMRAAELRGEPVYLDTVHQSPEGHRRWAEAVAGALTASGRARRPAAADVKPTGETVQNPALVPGGVEVDFSPEHRGGAVLDAPQNRLANAYGAKAVATVLSAGGSLRIAHAKALAIDLVVDSSSGFVGTVRATGGGADAGPAKTFTHAASTKTPRPQLRTVFSAQELRGSRNSVWNIEITEGTARVYGVVYQLPLPRK